MADELITAQDCAERWNVSESYARRLLAPLTPVDRDLATGAMQYRLADAEAARADRPGRGQRADLTAAPLSREDVQRLTTDESLPAAHRALWALMQSGMRLGDALSLDARDVLADEGVAVVETPVKGKPRPKAVPLSPDVLDLVQQAIGGRSEGPLLVNEEGRPLSRYLASRFAQATAGTSIHAFKPLAHSIDSDRTYVLAKDLKQGDTVHLDGMTGVVDKPPVLITDPSGSTKVSFVFQGTVDSVTWDGDLWVAVANRGETADD
ncbi:tyrosine-type recombinase/integrase [Streptomyces sp. NRRL B-24572]|uniref:tyrosine-type recombinase/integrase n=1 Tax=Streptomyces sp. NRRL B-24572 TaxID=1962156 RepID=UPI000A39F80F|nr:tyrosine-type recombinase/integrase [Streptomyces sp. NRRL B-24572]